MSATECPQCGNGNIISGGYRGHGVWIKECNNDNCDYRYEKEYR